MHKWFRFGEKWSFDEILVGMEEWTSKKKGAVVETQSKQTARSKKWLYILDGKRSCTTVNGPPKDERFD